MMVQIWSRNDISASSVWKSGCNQPRNRQLGITSRGVGGSFAELVEAYESREAASLMILLGPEHPCQAFCESVGVEVELVCFFINHNDGCSTKKVCECSESPAWGLSTGCRLNKGTAVTAMSISIGRRKEVSVTCMLQEFTSTKPPTPFPKSALA